MSWSTFYVNTYEPWYPYLIIESKWKARREALRKSRRENEKVHDLHFGISYRKKHIIRASSTRGSWELYHHEQRKTGWTQFPRNGTLYRWFTYVYSGQWWYNIIYQWSYVFLQNTNTFRACLKVCGVFAFMDGKVMNNNIIRTRWRGIEGQPGRLLKNNLRVHQSSPTDWLLEILLPRKQAEKKNLPPFKLWSMWPL